MYDNHLHALMSHDSKEAYENYIVRALILGLKGFTITEHWDSYKKIKTNLKTLDVDSYRNAFIEGTKDNKNLDIGFGIEIGLRPIVECVYEIKKTVYENKFDFIIGSSHITCNKDMSMDPTFFEGITKEEAIRKYLNEVLLNVHLYKECFDVYGHLDYVVRYVIKNYGLSKAYKLMYNDFRDILDAILIELIKNDKGLEINTSGLRYGLSEPHPNIEILKRYKELGGYIITMGSDAHTAVDMASNFGEAKEILLESGFNEVAVYRKRKPIFYGIK